MEYSSNFYTTINVLQRISIFLLLISVCQGRPGAPLWWSLAVSPRHLRIDVRPGTCTRIPGLTPKQLRYCSRRPELIPSIANGIKQGIDQCKYQFKKKRWNCNTSPMRKKRSSRRRSVFGPVLEKASREAAFVHSIAAAGVAFSVTRACTKGRVLTCGCGANRHMRRISQSLDPDWRWGGCNEDVDFGIDVSREFVDARDQGMTARAIMNRHNSEAGRLALRDKMQFQCKCHGLSGSCELRTCWWSLPSFKAVGDKLKRLYNGASEMKVKRHLEARGWVETLVPKLSVFNPPTEHELLYFEASPNFCDRNKRLGIKGTRGRVCNATSFGADGCDLLCCGRGHRTRQKARTEKCNCVFHWCCKVTCEECVVQYERHVCL